MKREINIETNVYQACYGLRSGHSKQSKCKMLINVNFQQGYNSFICQN